MNRDQEITQTQWDAMCEGLSLPAKRKVANWVAHGATASKTAAGVILTRKDFQEEGFHYFISNDGEQSKKAQP